MNIQQKGMAIAIGTATNHLNDIERGRKKPSLELLMRISSFLDTPVDYFLMDNPSPKNWLEMWWCTQVAGWKLT